MAFIGKIGKLLKNSAVKHINHDVSVSTPSVFQAIRSMSSAKVFVGGISFSTDDMSMREACARYGEVIDARVIIDRDSQRSRGFGFVTFATSEDASSPNQALNGQVKKFPQTEAFSRSVAGNGLASVQGSSRMLVPAFRSRFMSTEINPVDSSSQESFAREPEVPQRIKFKRLDKTGRHIMQILDKEALEEVRAQRGMPDIKPGYTVQLKVEVPENKRRVSIIKGTVIARRNAGLNSTFRIRRQVAGVCIECLYPLYSPNIKEVKVLDKSKVRRAKLYFLRDRMNALKK